MMMEGLARAMQADREREIREALRARAMVEQRQAPPEPVSPTRVTTARHPAPRTYTGSATA
jgi:hypothetical protein